MGVLTLLGVAPLQVGGHQWSQLPATHLRPLQPPCPYELLDLLRLHLGHEQAAAPGHQRQGAVLGQVGAGGDDVLPDAAGHEAAEAGHGVGVGAGVVQRHHRAVLDVVQPPLGRHEPGHDTANQSSVFSHVTR